MSRSFRRVFGFRSRNSRAVLPLTVLLFGLLSGSAWSGMVFVGEGSTLDTGDGVLSLGCGDLAVAGQKSGETIAAGDIHILSGGTLGPGTRLLSGDWSNAGETSVPGAVRWRDDCNTNEVLLLGSTEFEVLDIASPSGRTFRFDAGGMQRVNQGLYLAGSPDALLTLRSTSPGQHAELTLASSGTQSIVHVNVADLDASGGQGLAPGPPHLYASRDAGNNLNWFRGVLNAIPVPALTGAGIAWLALLFLFIALLRSGWS
jgi:hypothetical protein